MDSVHKNDSVDGRHKINLKQSAIINCVRSSRTQSTSAARKIFVNDNRSRTYSASDVMVPSVQYLLLSCSKKNPMQSVVFYGLFLRRYLIVKHW